MNIRSIAIASLLPVLFQAAPAVASEQDFHDIAAEVSAERIERDIRTLAGFGTRHTLSETGSDTRGIGARRWIEAEFNRISNACGGCLEAFTVSGVVSGEEQGLHGGRIIAQYAIDNGWNLDAVLNNDMIGNITGVNGVSNNTTARVFSEGTRYVETSDEANQRRFQGGEVDSPSRNIARYVDAMADGYIPNLDTMMIYRVDRFGRGGHHRPFNEAGFPAVRIMETNENYTQQHQDIRVEDGIAFGDVLEHVNFEYAAKLTALNAVTLAAMAWAPAPPANSL